MNKINTKDLNIDVDDIKTYNTVLKYLYQSNKISFDKEKIDILRSNVLRKSVLWKYGVSGDNPIITIEITDISGLDFIYEALKLFEYFKTKLINIDLVIINKEEKELFDIINHKIEDEKNKIDKVHGINQTSGEIVIIDGRELSQEEKNVFDALSIFNLPTEQ